MSDSKIFSDRARLLRNFFPPGGGLKAIACFLQTETMSGLAADNFLGTQGDPWDTQTDMLWALIGATISVLVLSRVHDKSMAKVAPEITAQLA